MLKNKKVLIALMIVGYGILLLGFTSFSILGLVVSFIGGMMVLLPLLYMGIKIHSRKKVISLILIIISSLGFLAMITDSIGTAIVIINK